MEEFEPKKKVKIFSKAFLAKYSYVLVLAVLLIGGISYSYTFFTANKKIASGTITTANLTINFSNRELNATNLVVPTTDQEGLSEFSKELTITNATSVDGKVELSLTRTSGLNLNDLRYALIINGAIQEIDDVPISGKILSSAIMGNETVNVEVRLWPKTTYTGSTKTFVGELTPEIRYLGSKATTSISEPSGKYVNFNCSSTCEVWRIVKVEDDRLVLTRQSDYTNATARTNSNKYNPSLTFNDNSMITSVSTDNLNVYLAKTVKIDGGSGTQTDPYTLINNDFREEDKKVIAQITYKDNNNTTVGTQNIYYNETNYISQVIDDADFTGWTDGTNDYAFGDVINFTTDTNLTAKMVQTLLNIIARQVSTASYIASYDDIITQNPTFTTQDQVSDSATKQTVYYYTGNEAAANSNVLFAGYCWQVVRTTDNGGVRMIYNGIAQKPVIASTPITNTDITYTNDGTYAYTYDSTTKKWTSANTGVASSTDTFIFSVNTAGDYAINYKVSSQANNDYAKIYIKPTGGSFILQTQYSGEVEGTFDLGTLGATDEVKIEYTKNGSTDTGDDNIIFDIASVNTRGDTPVCAQDRRITGIKGINAIGNEITQSMSAATRYGRSFDYDLTTGEFTIEDSTGLPTSWSTSDNNSNGIEDYKELIGTYTCLSNSATCSTLYYVGSINQFNTAQAYVSKYTIGDVAHYSQMGTSAYNANYSIPAMVGYMFNTEYDYKEGSKSGEYYTTATWNGTTYDLTSGNEGTAPDVSHHYICDTDCTKVRYYYYSTNYYILLENGTTVEDAIYKMTGNGTVETKSKTNNANYELNNYNSAMKGYLDNWYKKNLTGYTSFLDGTSVYCNDRSIRELGGWNPTNSPSLTKLLQFYQYSANRDLNCVNETDRFAVTNTKAKLTYPIGLLTEPERNLMTANFAKTGQYYWGASPYGFRNSYVADVRSVTATGGYSSIIVNYSYGARGVVSLRPGTKLEKGTGTYNDPYVVDVN